MKIDVARSSDTVGVNGDRLAIKIEDLKAPVASVGHDHARLRTSGVDPKSVRTRDLPLVLTRLEED